MINKIKSYKTVLSFVFTAALLFILFLLSVNTGSLRVSPFQLFKGLFFEFDESVSTIYDLRFPRIFIAVFGGAAISVSGVLIQSVMKNPLADPGLIGISAGATIIAVVVSIFFPTLYFFTPFFAFIGGFIAFIIVYSISWNGELSPLRIILVGIAVNSMLTGILNAFISGAGSKYSGVSGIVNANITMKTWKDFKMLIVYVILGLVAAFALASKCNLLALNDKTVRSLGKNITIYRIIISVVAVLLASASTAVIGPVSFLGLVVPHMARLIVGTDHKRLIPFSAISGSFVFLLADTLGRTVARPYEISASIVMAVIGGPFFIILLRRSEIHLG